MVYNKNIDGIEISYNLDVEEKELCHYIRYVKEKNPGRDIDSISLDFDGEEVGVGYYLAPVKFEKIRRITGYLVGTVDRFNDAKAAEERDRVKHA